MVNSTVTALSDVTVLSPSGEQVRMGSLWESRPILLAMMRHFGCIFCKEQVTQLSAHRPRIQAAGGELVILGNGTPQHAAWFIEDYGVDAPVYTDPDLVSHGILGARRGSVVDPRVFLRGFSAMRHGFRQTKTMGPAALNGGIFVITPDNEMPYRYLSRFAGDHPDPEAALRALEAAAKVSVA